MTKVKRFEFGIRDTPKGAVGWMKTPKGDFREKRFRNGYAGARIMAQKWIDEMISLIREMEQIDGLEVSEIIQAHKPEPALSAPSKTESVLLPCPFCGHPAEQYYSDVHEGIFTGCNNHDGCQVQPWVRSAQRKSGAKTWNRRFN